MFSLKKSETVVLIFFFIGTGILAYANGTDAPHSEANELSEKPRTFNELTTYFQELSREKGALYAFDVLQRASFPQNIDLHLLGHVVGDELYAQAGTAGMADCTHDFRNACSHSIVINTFYEFGENALPAVQEACRNAPGGSGAYTMCFHGFGHGVFSYYGYDFPATAALCERTGTEAYNDEEFTQCVGGAVMEIVGGGFHDREKWQVARETYLDTNDPTALCFAAFISEKARDMCLLYITPFLWEAAGGNIGRPTADVFETSFRFCEALEDTEARKSCYAGFGKDFLGLVLSRDIRLASLEQLDKSSFRQILQWCRLAPTAPGQEACLFSALSSLYWGGENDRSLSLSFCSVLGESGGELLGERCLSHLTGQVSRYVSDIGYRASFCSEVPLPYRDQCTASLL